MLISLNAFLPPQTDVVYKGHVITKDEVKGRSTEYYLTLDERDSYGFELRLQVSPREFEAYDVGDLYRRYMQRGGLGFDYRLRW